MEFCRPATWLSQGTRCHQLCDFLGLAISTHICPPNLSLIPVMSDLPITSLPSSPHVHTHAPTPAPRPGHLQSATCICHPRSTLLSLPGVRCQKQAKICPPLEFREIPLYVLKVREWAGAALLQALRVNGPSQAKVTDNTERSVTENSPCVYFFGEFSQDGPASPLNILFFVF